MSAKKFRDWRYKAISLLGMSGVGKTRLSRLLRKESWFHYSGDYRIGTRYLSEVMLDNIKLEAMQNPLLRKLLLTDSIYIKSNISIDNLDAISVFLGKLGDPQKGGMSLKEFKGRQDLYRQAEIAAMQDVPGFIQRAREVYGYHYFVNDAGGSLCELETQEAMELLAKHTMILYIEATANDTEALIRRAQADPKPLYYRESFFDEQLAIYRAERNLEYVALIDPDDFSKWLFPQLLNARIPCYEELAKKYGYTLSSSEVAQIKTAEELIALIETKLD